MTRVAPPTREDVQATKRRPMTLARKKRVHDLYNGRCGICGDPVPLTGKGLVVYDHRIPLWMNGADDDGPNLQCLCGPCDAVKTPNDQTAIAKVKRLRGETGNGTKRPIPSKGFPKPTTKTRWPKRAFGKQKLKEAQHDD